MVCVTRVTDERTGCRSVRSSRMYETAASGIKTSVVESKGDIIHESEVVDLERLDSIEPYVYCKGSLQMRLVKVL